MKHYALLFYPTRSFAPEELNRRHEEIAAWAKQVTDMGITLDPRALGEPVATFSASGTETASPNGSANSPALTNIVFFDSPSQDQAVKIARMHPGLHYGVIVNLREWTAPRPVAATPAR